MNTTLLQIVEEPEQNLYPTSQVSATRKLIKNTNSIGRLIVTTHSPYILSAVNNFIFAYDLRDNIKKSPKGISKDEFIRYEDVSAYKIKDGRIFSILDDEARMIDATEIDECSIDINKLFDKLMDIKESIDEGQWHQSFGVVCRRKSEDQYKKENCIFWIQKAVKIMPPSDGYKKRWAFDISILQCLGMKDYKANP